MTQQHDGRRDLLPSAGAAARLQPHIGSPSSSTSSSGRCQQKGGRRRLAWQNTAAALLLSVAALAAVAAFPPLHSSPGPGTEGLGAQLGLPLVRAWTGGMAAQRRLLQQPGLPQQSQAAQQAQSAQQSGDIALDGTDMMNYTQTGKSVNNPDDFPVPEGYEPVMSAVHRIVGPYVIKNRPDMERAWQRAFENFFKPLGVEVRWTNYTVRPATNFGPVGSFLRASMRAVDEQVVMYQKKGLGPRTNLTLGTVFNQTAYLQQLVAVEYGFQDASLVVLSERAISPSFLASQGEYGGASTIIELTGENLDPFTVDKQNVVLLTLTTVFNALEANPVFYVNISNFLPDGHADVGLAPNGKDLKPHVSSPPAPIGRRLARRLMSGAPSGAPLGSPSNPVIIDVWTGMDPLRGNNMAEFWNRTLNQANAQQLYVINGDGGIGVAYTYRNFTATSQYYGVALVGKLQSSELYQRSDSGDYTVAFNANSTAPSSPPRPKVPAPALVTDAKAVPSPQLGPGADFVGLGGNAGLPYNDPGAIQPKSGGSNTGAIVGAVVGAIAGLLLLAAVIAGYLLLRRRRHAASELGKHTASSSDDGSPSSSESGLGPASWRWDRRDSGVVEPVAAHRAMRHDSPLGRVDLFPSLHRADQLFANDTANHSVRDSDLTLSPLGSSLGSAAGSGVTDSPRSRLGGERTSSSGPWVAGELDPAEIEICRDAEGRKVVLGEGAFGRVYKGLRRGVHEVAVKQLGNLKDPQLIRQFRKEIAILGRVSFQPNIVNFYGACLRNPANIMLVMELMEGGDLRHALSADETGEFSWWGKGRALALDIAHGLHFLHSSGVTHRDLKTSNILLSKGGTTAKIGDVGLAKITLTDLQSSLATVGTFVYAAPELLMGDRCTEKADCFSFGVCLWEICTRDIPMRGYLRDVHAPAECPEDIRALLAECMNSDPAQRPSAEELVRRIAAAPHSQEEAEAAMAAVVQQASVRSISLTGLRDPVPAADLAQQRGLSLQAVGTQSSFPGASAVQRGLSVFGGGRQSSAPGLQQQPLGSRGGSPTAALGPTAEASFRAEAGRSSEESQASEDTLTRVSQASATDDSTLGDSASQTGRQDDE